MGFGGISVWQLLIVLAIVVLIFGTKKLRGMGGDFGGAIKNFKSAMNDPKQDDTADDKPAEQISSAESSNGETIDVEAKKKTES